MWQASCHIWVICSIHTRGQQIYWKTYLSDQTNTLTVIILKTWGKDDFLTKWIDIGWNDAQRVKLVKRKWHNTVIPQTDKDHSECVMEVYLSLSVKGS